MLTYYAGTTLQLTIVDDLCLLHLPLDTQTIHLELEVRMHLAIGERH